jgi:hypothetical protein
VGDPPRRWEALGFNVVNATCEIGGIRLELGADGHGITKWELSGIASGTREIDGLETGSADDSSRPITPNHQNGAIAIDHVVVTTPGFDRTAAALTAAGMPLRRVVERRDGRRMGFRRLGGTILELVEAPAPVAGPARFWGLVVVVEDLEALAEGLGERLGSIRQAVQPGRQIATVRESAGLEEAVAFMSPEQRS